MEPDDAAGASACHQTQPVKISTSVCGSYRKDYNRIYFLKRFSNAWRASLGRRVAGVEVSFSRVTRIS